MIPQVIQCGEDDRKGFPMVMRQKAENIFSKQIPRPFGFNHAGKFKEESASGVGVLVDLTMSDALETAGAGQPGPKAADTREHIKIADQVISPSSWSVRKKPRMSSSTSLASCCTDFSLVG